MKHTYRNRYWHFVIRCTIFLILKILGIVGYCTAVIHPATKAILYGSRIYGKQFLVLLIIPLIWSALAWIVIRWRIQTYYRALLSLLRGAVLVKSGRITQKQGRRYYVSSILPKRMKKASYPHLTRPVPFSIRNGDCERRFQVDDLICVVYPASSDLYTPASAIPAIYAFSADDADRSLNIPMEPLRGKEWEKRRFCFLLFVTLIAAALSILLIFLWRVIWLNTSWGARYG